MTRDEDQRKVSDEPGEDLASISEEERAISSPREEFARILMSGKGQSGEEF